MTVYAEAKLFGIVPLHDRTLKLTDAFVMPVLDEKLASILTRQRVIKAIDEDTIIVGYAVRSVDEDVRVHFNFMPETIARIQKEKINQMNFQTWSDGILFTLRWRE